MNIIFKIQIFVLILSFTVVYSQRYEKLTTKERNLILSDSAKMMRVIQRKFAEDSIILKSVSKPIDPNDKLTSVLVKRMLKSVKNPLHLGVGIAAPQVGINRRMILVRRFDKAEKPFEVFINPEIIWKSNLYRKGHEGDLSFDGYGKIMRHYVVHVRYHNAKGEGVTEILEDFTAVIFQHERDHLDGILLTDRLKEQEEIKYTPAFESSDLFFSE